MFVETSVAEVLEFVYAHRESGYLQVEGQRHKMRHFVHVEEMRVHILQNQRAGTEEGAELHRFDYLAVTQHQR